MSHSPTGKHAAQLRRKKKKEAANRSMGPSPAKRGSSGKHKPTKKQKSGTTATPGFRVYQTEQGHEVDNLPHLLASASAGILVSGIAVVLLLGMNLTRTETLAGWFGLALILVPTLLVFRKWTRIVVDHRGNSLRVERPYQRHIADLVLSRGDIIEFGEQEQEATAPAKKSKRPKKVLVAFLKNKEVVPLADLPDSRALKSLVQIFRSA